MSMFCAVQTSGLFCEKYFPLKLMADPDIDGRARWDEGILYRLSDRARVAKSLIIYSMKFNEKKVSFTQQKMNEFSNVFWSEISCFLVRNLAKLDENRHF